MPDELLDLLFDHLVLHEGSESSHDASLEMDATSPGFFNGFIEV